ncbi:HutD family protein [Shewanella sp. AS16]|uniref:HutD/Ves family protein n=1 Tax=Shewanella sp. AS16 TaxID=2907625 RepID=UPI001F3108D0|nr:HutD family protein [Shewanella sp. AS16]MCE9686743.1 HutD family protein [Shewanella sp. AS16]
MDIIRFNQCQSTQWKNGGGTTTQLIIAPPGAGLDNFDYRVSMARVNSDTPFSQFEAIDRQLLILEGEGLALEIEGKEGAATLLKLGPALAFAGELMIGSKLLAGPVLDFNVMTRRGHYRAKTEYLRLEKNVGINQECRSRRCLLIFLTQTLCLTGEGMPALELQTYDLLSYEAGETIFLQPQAAAGIIRVWLDRP